MNLLNGGKFATPTDARNALIVRGMDFKIEKHPLKVNGFDIVIPNKMATVRMDKMIPLGIVGSGYEVKDYVESFVDSMGILTRESGAVVTNAGYFGNGEKGFIQATLPDLLTVEGTDGGDSIEKTLTMITAHDGSLPLIICETAIRIVCQNTFRAASKDKTGFRMTARHSASMDERIVEIRKALAHSESAYAKLAQDVNTLASKGTSPDDVKAYLSALLPAKGETVPTRTENMRLAIANLAENGKGQDIKGVRGTYWALYNGVTEYVDHSRSTRGADDAQRESNRLESVMIGTGADLKDRAFDLALEMAS